MTKEGIKFQELDHQCKSAAMEHHMFISAQMIGKNDFAEKIIENKEGLIIG